MSNLHVRCFGILKQQIASYFIHMEAWDLSTLNTIYIFSFLLSLTMHSTAEMKNSLFPGCDLMFIFSWWSELRHSYWQPLRRIFLIFKFFYNNFLLKEIFDFLEISMNFHSRNALTASTRPYTRKDFMKLKRRGDICTHRAEVFRTYQLIHFRVLQRARAAFVWCAFHLLRECILESDTATAQRERTCMRHWRAVEKSQLLII